MSPSPPPTTVQVTTSHLDLQRPLAAPCASPLLPTHFSAQPELETQATGPDNTVMEAVKQNQSPCAEGLGSTKRKCHPLLGSPGRLPEEELGLGVEGDEGKGIPGRMTCMSKAWRCDWLVCLFGKSQSCGKGGV